MRMPTEPKSPVLETEKSRKRRGRVPGKGQVKKVQGQTRRNQNTGPGHVLERGKSIRKEGSQDPEVRIRIASDSLHYMLYL